LQTEPERRFFRIVIGCYSHRAWHWSARDELRSNGLQDHQMCSLGSRSALALDGCCQLPSVPVGGSRTGFVEYHPRQVKELEVHVSSTCLFDGLWPVPHDHDGSLTRWMTPAQSSILWRKLCDNYPLLMVSADSAEQQIRSSQIQLRHGPTVVQAFNFAV
jgi:hypothetical protein